MKHQLTLTAGILLCLSLSSCITSGVVAAAAGAKAIGDATSALTDNVTGFITGDKAPASLAGKIVALSGSVKDAANTSQNTSDALSFAEAGASTRTVNGTTQTLSYVHTVPNTGVIAITAPTGLTEIYTLTFTGSDKGTYTYERKGDAANTATGEGSFTIK